MNRLSREILEKRYNELRRARDILRDENKELQKEIKILNDQVKKLKEDMLEMTYLLDTKIEVINDR